MRTRKGLLALFLLACGAPAAASQQGGGGAPVAASQQGGGQQQRQPHDGAAAIAVPAAAPAPAVAPAPAPGPSSNPYGSVDVVALLTGLTNYSRATQTALQASVASVAQEPLPRSYTLPLSAVTLVPVLWAASSLVTVLGECNTQSLEVPS